jgi:superoxide dismutase
VLTLQSVFFFIFYQQMSTSLFLFALRNVDLEFNLLETHSLCPIDTQCLDLLMLDAVERAWLDDYQATVRRRLSPLLNGGALDWLRTHTEALSA